ncbi:MAG: ribosome-binding factor A [Candidatus Pacebacteria bacterium]|jgi:ribosome-binding factor A|nr:ribosome-binding factor A [Candidatus Paceibacterota bacterium]|tara:strand:+ start:2245 stop:2547 length:303 start_codon:yes stop_codon:yes gene_type:complete
MSLRAEKVSGLVRELAAEFLAKESDRTSIITVTRANISSNLKEAKIYLSVYPQDSEKVALKFAKRKRSEFRKYAQERMQIKKIPTFDFEIDMGEKKQTAN